MLLAQDKLRSTWSILSSFCLKGYRVNIYYAHQIQFNSDSLDRPKIYRRSLNPWSCGYQITISLKIRSFCSKFSYFSPRPKSSIYTQILFKLKNLECSTLINSMIFTYISNESIQIIIQFNFNLSRIFISIGTP